VSEASRLRIERTFEQAQEEAAGEQLSKGGDEACAINQLCLDLPGDKDSSCASVTMPQRKTSVGRMTLGPMRLRTRVMGSSACSMSVHSAGRVNRTYR
jgi:hypothetical protein